MSITITRFSQNCLIVMHLNSALFALQLLLISTLVHSHFLIGCDTPNGEQGACISTLDCPLVFDLVLKYSNNMPPMVMNQLREMAKCNGQKGTILPICCPITSISKGGSNTHESIKQTSPDLSYIDPLGMQLLRSVLDCDNREVERDVNVVYELPWMPMRTFQPEEAPLAVAHGVSVELYEFPWMALLKYDTEGRPFLCGGSLITDRFVLTAAHCTTTANKLIGVRLGEHNLATPANCNFGYGRQFGCLPFEEYGIEDIRVHPNYTKGAIGFDIALLKLDRQVVFRFHIRPICLPISQSSQYLGPNKSFFVAGWGKTEYGIPSSVLLKAMVKQQHLDICRSYYSNAPLTDNHICALGESRQETCHGDSGGPLFIRSRGGSNSPYIQVGIVSSGGRTCGIHQDQPGVFASVIDMLPWITQNLY